MTPRRRNPRQDLVDSLEAERLRPTPRPPGHGLRCEWVPRCGSPFRAWADDPGGTGWVPVCAEHRRAAEIIGAATRERL